MANKNYVTATVYYLNNKVERFVVNSQNGKIVEHKTFYVKSKPIPAKSSSSMAKIPA